MSDNSHNNENREFLKRLREAVDQVGGPTAAAVVTGLSRRTINAYLAAETDPSRERILALARGLGVSPSWLLTGEGIREAGKWPNLGAHDLAVMAENSEQQIIDSPEGHYQQGIPHAKRLVNLVQNPNKHLFPSRKDEECAATVTYRLATEALINSTQGLTEEEIYTLLAAWLKARGEIERARYLDEVSRAKQVVLPPASVLRERLRAAANFSDRNVDDMNDEEVIRTFREIEQALQSAHVARDPQVEEGKS